MGLYAAVLFVGLALIRSERRVRAMLLVLGGAFLLLSLYVEARLLSGTGSGLFLDHRLDDGPMGYTNGMAATLLMGAFLALALVELPTPAVAGTGVGSAAFCANLATLTQSRAVLFVGATVAIIALALLPGRARRLFAMVTIVAAALAATPWTLAVYEERIAGQPSPVSDGVLLSAGVAALISAVVAGLVWGLIAWLAPRRSPRLRHAPEVAAGVLILASALALLVAEPHPVGAIAVPSIGSRRIESTTADNPLYRRRRPPLRPVASGRTPVLACTAQGSRSRKLRPLLLPAQTHPGSRAPTPQPGAASPGGARASGILTVLATIGGCCWVVVRAPVVQGSTGSAVTWRAASASSRHGPSTPASIGSTTPGSDGTGSAVPRWSVCPWAGIVARPGSPKSGQQFIRIGSVMSPHCCRQHRATILGGPLPGERKRCVK